MNPKWYNKQENNCHELFKKAEISVKKKKVLWGRSDGTFVLWMIMSCFQLQL